MNCSAGFWFLLDLSICLRSLDCQKQSAKNRAGNGQNISLRMSVTFNSKQSKKRERERQRESRDSTIRDIWFGGQWAPLRPLASLKLGDQFHWSCDHRLGFSKTELRIGDRFVGETLQPVNWWKSFVVRGGSSLQRFVKKSSTWDSLGPCKSWTTWVVEPRHCAKNDHQGEQSYFARHNEQSSDGDNCNYTNGIGLSILSTGDIRMGH